MLFHLLDVMPKFFLNIFYGAESSFQTISYISIPRKQIWKKYFTLCITMHMMRVCMTQRYEMICCAHDLLSDHAQKLLKTKKKETHLNLNPIFSFFQFSLFWSSHTIPIILYSTNIFFCKKNFLFFIIFNMVYFFYNTFLF